MVEPSNENPGSRRVARIRQEIAAGTYETPEKLSAALDVFLDVFLDGVERGEVRVGEDRPSRDTRPE